MIRRYSIMIFLISLLGVSNLYAQKENKFFVGIVVSPHIIQNFSIGTAPNHPNSYSVGIGTHGAFLLKKHFFVVEFIARRNRFYTQQDFSGDLHELSSIERSIRMTSKFYFKIHERFPAFLVFGIGFNYMTNAYFNRSIIDRNSNSYVHVTENTFKGYWDYETLILGFSYKMLDNKHINIFLGVEPFINISLKWLTYDISQIGVHVPLSINYKF